MTATHQSALALNSNIPSIFNFGTHTVRVIMIDGEPWFVASDVCRALELSNPSESLRNLDAEERGISSTETPGGMQDMLIISESGLYTLILRCRDAVKAGTVPHRFRKWLTSEVLPSIRKTGRYSIEQEIDVRSLLLSGQSTPTVALPDDLTDAVYQRAWEMAREVHQIATEYLRRRIADSCEYGHPIRMINVQRAYMEISECTIGKALAHEYFDRLGEVRHFIQVAKDQAAKAIADIESNVQSISAA